MGKRYRNKSVTDCRKKRARSDKVMVKNYSESLTRCFERSGGGFVVYFYALKKCRMFGVLLPVKYTDSVELEFLNIFEFTYENLEMFRNFQQNMWRELLKAPEFSMGEVSEANYLVVPIMRKKLQNRTINLQVIERFSTQTMMRLTDMPPRFRKNLVVVSKSGEKFIYLDQVTSNIHDFFEKLYGESCGDMEEAVEKYNGWSINEILFKANINCQSLLEFRKINKEKKCTDVVFAIRTWSVKHEKLNSSLKRPSLFLAEDLSVFYLSSAFWEQGYLLLNSLIELESFSYVVDFAKKISYQGNLQSLKQALTSSAVDPTCNYEPLNTLGDSIIKFLTTLDLYLQDPNSSEGQMTKSRCGIVSNKNLTEISRKLEFEYYIKTSSIPVSHFRPAYYFHLAGKDETFDVELKISDGILTDVFKALVGSFYISEGLIASAQFLKNTSILSDKSWIQLKKYLNAKEIRNISKLDIDFYIQKSYKIKELYKKPSTMKMLSNGLDTSYDQYYYIKNSISYSFANRKLLERAFISKTVSNYNYEILEFLGDSALDLIILCNIYSCGNFNSNELSQIKTLLVCNQNLCCISLVTGMSRFLQTEEDDETLIMELKADEMDIVKDRLFTLKIPKRFGDLFEALIGAVLLDSGSIEIAAEIIGNFMKKQIIYAVKNINLYLRLQKLNQQYDRFHDRI